MIFNWSQYGYDQRDVILCSLAGLLCSIIIISTYFISNTFRSEFKSAKLIILTMSCLSFFHSISLLDVEVDKPNIICAVQAVCLQVLYYI